MNPDQDPSKPRLSSTLLLLRQEKDLEVLMVKRHHQIDFASGALVFPGGKISEDDKNPNWRDHIDGNFEGDALYSRIGGIREVFEESGLVVARHRAGAAGTHVGPDVCDRLGPFRAEVDRGEKSFFEIVRDNDLVLDLNAMIPYAHWITPTMMPKRFDTWFYAVIAPENQLARHDGRETTDAVWVTPSDVLKQEKEGSVTMLFPTRVNVEKLEDLGSAEQVLSACSASMPVTVLPVVNKDETGAFLEIPAEAGYRVTREPLERVTG